MNEAYRCRYHLQHLVCFLRDQAKLPADIAARLRSRRTDKRPISYIGWTGYKNLGDEAMAQSISQRFAGRGLVPLKNGLTERTLERIGLGGADVFSAALLGGGTLINSSYLPLAQYVERSGLPFYAFGTGVGSVGFSGAPQTSLDGWSDVLNRCRMIGVRGPLSLRQLKQAGVGDAIVIGDPALGFALERATRNGTRRRLLINLTSPPDQGYASGDSAVIRTVEKIAKNFSNEGGEVVGLALGIGDAAVLSRFREEAALPHMNIESHHHSVFGFLQAAEGSVGLISIRLHGAVLAACAGVPSVLLSYRSKCLDFMSSIGMEEFAVPFSADAGPQLEERWMQLRNDPRWGGDAHRQALRWKRVQQSFAGAIARDLQASA